MSMKYSFPLSYGLDGCFLVPIDKALIGIVAGRLKELEEERTWGSWAEYELAYNAFAELHICMTKLCAEELIESNNRVYRLLDTALYGRVYTVQQSEPELIVSPALPPVPDATNAMLPGLLARSQRIERLLDNALNGAISAEYATPEGVREKLDRLIAAIQTADDLDPDMLAELIKIVALLA
jgi:hypothetical protein